MLTTIGELALLARQGGSAAFFERVTVPALVFLHELYEDPIQLRAMLVGADDPDETTGHGDPTPTHGVRGFPVPSRPERTAVPVSATPVLLVRKRTTLTSFEDVVTVGRATSQDLVLASPTVSKLHACFTRFSDGWRLTDWRSTNGTFVGGIRLAPQLSARVADGALVQLGSQVRARFTMPESLLALVRSARRDTPVPNA